MQINNSVKHALILSYGLDDSRRAHDEGKTKEKTDSSGIITYLDEADTPDFEERLETLPTETRGHDNHTTLISLCPSSGTFADIRLTYKLLEEGWSIPQRAFDLVTSQGDSCYYSSTTSVKGQPCFEITYNTSERLTFAMVDSNTDQSIEQQQDSEESTELNWINSPLYFRYNFHTGQTTCILDDASPELREFLQDASRRLGQTHPTLSSDMKLQIQHHHPFSVLVLIMYHILSERNAEIANLTRRLVWIEKKLIEGTIFEVTDSRQYTTYTHVLHKLSRRLIFLEQHSMRNMSTIENLLRDHEKLWTKAKNIHRKASAKGDASSHIHIDEESYERVQDALCCLRDFITQRSRVLQSFKQRSQNFIALLYNLMAGRDSSTNLQIATASAKISQSAKRDSAAMKTIAALTLLYLPATFVCSLFGTNFFALDTKDPPSSPSTSSSPSQISNDDDGAKFVVSNLWWVYLAVALPLTGLTMLIFWIWNMSALRRVREKHKYENDERWRAMLGNLMDSSSLLRTGGGLKSEHSDGDDDGDGIESEDWHAVSSRIDSLNFFTRLEGRKRRGFLPVWNSRGDR